MAAGEDLHQFQRTLDWGLNLGLMLGLPAAVALYLLSDALLATLFMSFTSGAMTAHDVRMAGIALQMFAVALPGFVLVKILSPAFFAHEDTRSPLRYASGAVAANLLVSLATFSWFGHVGLAWATAVSAWTHVLLLYLGLQRRGLYVVTSRLWPLLWKTLLASGMLAAALVVIGYGRDWMQMAAGERLFWVLGVSSVGVVLYLALLAVFGVRLHHVKHMSSR